MFEKEFLSTTREIISNLKSMENTITELNILHKSFDTPRSYVLKTVLKVVLDSLKDGKESELVNQVRSSLEKFKPLFKKFREVEDDLDLIFDLQEYCSMKENEKIKKVFPIILHTLYQMDLLEEDAIFKWEKESSEEDSTFVNLVRTQLSWKKI